jgi:hypothetical protein
VTVDEYLASIKARLLSDPVILDFHIVRERMTLTDAHLRVRVTLADTSRLEFSEYAQRSINGKIEVVTYSYHWADSEDKLIRRWDNTPHFPNLPNFPHHTHNGLTGTVEPGQPVDFFVVLDIIVQQLSAS